MIIAINKGFSKNREVKLVFFFIKRYIEVGPYISCHILSFIWNVLIHINNVFVGIVDK